MGSNWGFHIAAGDRHGLKDVLRAAAQAGAPIRTLFSVDQDVSPDVLEVSPNTPIIFRTQARGDNPQGFFDHADMGALARDWMPGQMAVWAKNKATYYAPGNEEDPGTVDQSVKISDFYLAAMQIAGASGYQLAIGNFSSGCPADGLLPDGTPDPDNTLEKKLAAMLPMFRYAHDHGHILALHVHPEMPLETTGESIALRYRRISRYLKAQGAGVPLVLSEASNGPGGFQPNVIGWRNSMTWLDIATRLDPECLGFDVYTLGGAENIKDQMKWIQAWVVSQAAGPSPVPIPPPAPETVKISITTQNQNLIADLRDRYQNDPEVIKFEEVQV